MERKNNKFENEIKKLVNSDEVFNTFISLYERWQDEKMYENFDEYVRIMSSYIPKNAQIIKGSKRPFGLQFSFENHKVHIFLKFIQNSKYAKLCVKVYN